MSTVYLLARNDRREEMQQVATDLAEYGIKNIATWVDGDHDDIGVPDAAQAKFAAEDLKQVSEADLVIVFTDASGKEGRGGNHIEFGFALGRHGEIVIIGPIENMFIAYAVHTKKAGYFATYPQFLETVISAKRALKLYSGLPREIRSVTREA